MYYYFNVLTTCMETFLFVSSRWTFILTETLDRFLLLQQLVSTLHEGSVVCCVQVKTLPFTQIYRVCLHWPFIHFNAAFSVCTRKGNV